MNTYHRTADGRQVAEHEAIDESGCIRDGFSMRTKAMLMDGVPVVDPFAPLTDEQKVARIDRLNARLSDAWRSPTPLADTARPHQPMRFDAGDAGDTYERYDRRVEDAWRQPA